MANYRTVNGKKYNLNEGAIATANGDTLHTSKHGYWLEITGDRLSFEKENGAITLTGYIAFKENYFIASRTFTYTEDNGKGRTNLTITEDTGRKYPLKRSITTADKQKLIEFINKFDVSLLINKADTIKREWENFTGYTSHHFSVEEVFKRNEECWHEVLI